MLWQVKLFRRSIGPFQRLARKLVPESGAVDEDLLAFFAAHDTDGFNQWESGQKAVHVARLQYHGWKVF